MATTTWTAIKKDQPTITPITQEEAQEEIKRSTREFRKVNKNAGSIATLLAKIDRLRNGASEGISLQEIITAYNTQFNKSQNNAKIKEDLQSLRIRVVTEKKSSIDQEAAQIFTKLLKETDSAIKHASSACKREASLLKNAYNKIINIKNHADAWKVINYARSFWQYEPSLIE